jgi:hypothetical protein
MPEIGAVLPPPNLRKQHTDGDAIQRIKPTSKHAAVLRFPGNYFAEQLKALFPHRNRCINDPPCCVAVWVGETGRKPKDIGSVVTLHSGNRSSRLLEIDLRVPETPHRPGLAVRTTAAFLCFTLSWRRRQDIRL